MPEIEEIKVDRQQRLSAFIDPCTLTQALTQAIKMVDELGEAVVNRVELNKVFAEDEDDTDGWKVDVSSWVCPHGH